MKLYVKHMVSRRCIMIVKLNLQQVGIRYTSVGLGLIETVEDISREKIEELNRILAIASLELIKNDNEILVEQIKTLIRELVHHTKNELKTNLSLYLSEKLNRSYDSLAHSFSQAEGMTLEHFIILNRIERVKELLIYDQLTLTEISYKMHYSSVAYLSYQFKKVTGLTPTQFKKQKDPQRRNIELL